MERAVAEAGPSPRDRLWAYLRSNFQPPVLDPNLLATWISFWSLNKTNPAIAATHAETYGGGRERMEVRSEEHTSELQSLMRISYAVFCLKKKTSIYPLVMSSLVQCQIFSFYNSNI